MSLRDLIILLGLVAVLASFVLPKIGDFRNRASVQTARLSAQQVARVAESAKIGGEGELAVASTKEEFVQMLAEGVEGCGVYEGVEYQVQLDEKQRVAVLPYLKLEEGTLTYDGSPDFD